MFGWSLSWKFTTDRHLTWLEKKFGVFNIRTAKFEPRKGACCTKSHTLWMDKITNQLQCSYKFWRAGRYFAVSRTRTVLRKNRTILVTGVVDVILYLRLKESFIRKSGAQVTRYFIFRTLITMSFFVLIQKSLLFSEFTRSLNITTMLSTIDQKDKLRSQPLSKLHALHKKWVQVLKMQVQRPTRVSYIWWKAHISSYSSYVLQNLLLQWVHLSNTTRRAILQTPFAVRPKRARTWR
jgi:hypothetical protein